jgi:hypothetical protein
MTHRQFVSTASAPSTKLALALVFGVLASFADTTGAASPADQATSEPVQAIWKQQEITFYYQSFTTFYSCTGLEGKLERIMKALGVYAKVRVRSADCPSSVARMPRVVMKVSGPVEATPEALADRDQNKSVRELAERVQGKNRKVEKYESRDQFPAQWKRVSLTRGRLNLEPGDCELVEEIQKKVLPKLAVRIVDNDLLCSPNQLTLGQPRLEVDALIEMPKPDDKPAKQPDA